MAGVRLVFQVMIFVFIMNLTIGLIGYIFPEMYGTPEFTSGMSYNQGDIDYLNAQSDTMLTPGTQVSGGSGFFSSILDALTAGYYSKIKEFIIKYFYGLPVLLENFFGPFMSEELSWFFFDILLKGMLTMMYIFAIAWMFTGRNLFKEGL
jgi:hypothetical protein